jgi:DNA-binding SARP family transcriptional activator
VPNDAVGAGPPTAGGAGASAPARSWPEPHGLRRARLLEVLRRPARLTVVIAPAGSGKTTLLAQHAEALGTAAVWYRALRFDIEPDRLVDGLLRAATGADPAAAARAEERADPFERLLAALGPGPRTLVVDDAHLLLDSPAEETVDRLLAEGPRELSMVLGSRRAPGLNLLRAELGDVRTVDADDLRFRSWEVESLFRDHYEAPLPPDDVAALARHTEGWAACLRLFHLSTRSRPLPERRRAVAALTGGPRFARAYLAKTILREIPDDLRAFLSRTAVFEVLTAERCDRLLDGTGAQARLEQLVRLEALTTTDDGGRTFRYHEVLRRHLESALLDELGPDRTSAWYERAARMLEEQGALGEALRAWLRAERWTEITRLLRHNGDRAISADPGHLWHELLPQQLIDEDPWLSTAIARRLAAEGRLPAAALRYRHAEALFPDSGDRERAARERRLVELWTIGRPQPHLHWLDRLREAVRRPRMVRREGGTAPGDRLGEAVAILLTGDVTRAAAAVGALLEDAEVDGALLLAARLLQVFLDALRSGDVAIAADGLGSDAERAGAFWIARQARVLHAFVTRDRAELGQVAGQCAALGDVWGELLGRGAETLRLLLDGEPAVAATQSLVERSRGLDAGALEAWAATLAALASAAERQPEAAREATAAEAFGRARGVWGAPALTTLALAATLPADEAPVALAQARTLAAAHGLPWSDVLEARLVGSVEAPPAAPATPADPVSAPVVPAQATAPAEPEPPSVRLRCFGGFALEVAGRALDWRSVRPRAATALRLLAARTPQAVHREVLLGLWPGLPPGQATHSLQVAVSSLRSLLAPDAPRGSFRMIERSGETYALVLPPGSTADVLEVDTALRAADRARLAGDPAAEAAALDTALASYTGELLPEDGPAEWVVNDREQWRLRAAAACARLAELRLAAAEPQAAIEAARRGVGIDPFSDALWRTLIAGYARTGDTAAAAKARQEYAEVLSELGLDSVEV